MWLLDKLEKLKNSNTIAIRYMDEFISYKELWHRSECIAKYLHDHGLNEKPLVIYGNKEIDIVPCMHAALKVGIPYVPVDTLYPIDRLNKIANAVKADLVVDFSKSDGIDCNVICDEELKNIYKEQNISGGVQKMQWANNEDIVYILFTSGSTGEPKGVPITKKNLVNFASWFRRYVNIVSGRSVTINQAPYSFDLSVIGLYVCLPLGSCLLNIDKNVSADFKLMDAYMLSYKPDIWVSTPSVIRTCLYDMEFIQNTKKNIQQFIFDGEILQKELAAKLFEYYPTAKIVNAYGPTEATVAITACEIMPQMLSDDNELPIGYPLDDGKLDIIKEGHEVNDNEVGELFVTSDSVACGYWNNKEQTEKCFSKDDKGDYKYCTGDLVYKQDGMFYYVGRKDFQIKLNGYRIELNDIEINMQNLPYVKACCVVPKVKNGKTEFLCAFVVLSDVKDTKIKMTMKIKKDLSKKIPVYMIPKKVIFIDELPLNINGKIDRKKLVGDL